MREIIFDTETTGLDPKTGDRMVEIGCVEMIDRIETGRSYHAYFNPQRDMPAEAQNVHGLSAAFLSTKPLFGECVEELLEFLEDSPLVAHNAGFDFGFLNAELALLKREPIGHDRMIDTVALARKRHPGAKLSLDALCTRYGVDRSHRVKHGALLDAELLAQVYIELTGGRQIGLELAALDGADSGASPDRVAPQPGLNAQHSAAATPQSGADKARRPVREPRAHAPSASELERHQAFIATLKEPLWTR